MEHFLPRNIVVRDGRRNCFLIVCADLIWMKDRDGKKLMKEWICSLKTIITNIVLENYSLMKNLNGGNSIIKDPAKLSVILFIIQAGFCLQLIRSRKKRSSILDGMNLMKLMFWY